MEQPIPEDWDGVSFCKWAVCWPDSVAWKAILYGLLESPTQGRYWDFTTGNFLELRALFRPAYLYNFNLKEVLMACDDAGLELIAQALNNIATSLNNQASATVQVSQECCDNTGSGGAGTNPPPFDPTTPGDPEVDPPPSGFETWEEFESDKCAIAWDIVETLLNDLGEIALLNLVDIGITSLATILAVALATPIPFVNITAVAAFLLSIAAEIVIATAISLLNANQEALVCALFLGTNSQNSRDTFLSQFNTIVDNAAVDPVEGFAIKTLIAYFMTSQVTNRLYIKDTAQSWPERDCSNCTVMLMETFPTGNGATGTIDGSDPAYTVASQPDGAGINRCAWRPIAGGCFQMADFILTGWENPSAYLGGTGVAYRDFATGNELVYGDSQTTEADVEAFFTGLPIYWISLATLDLVEAGDAAFTGSFTREDCA